MEELKSEVNRVKLEVSVINGRALGNKPLAEYLVHLKEVLYDADDDVDELDYCRLLQLELGGTQQVEVTSIFRDLERQLGLPIRDQDQTDGHHGASHADRSMENAHVPSASGTLPGPPETDGHVTQAVERSRGNAAAQSSNMGRLRSKLWKEFEIIEFNEKGAPVRAKCKHCDTVLGCPTEQGTAVLRNHLKSKACPYNPLSTADATTNPVSPLATGNLSSKKRRIDDDSTHLRTANTNHLIKDGFSKMIQDITLKLHQIREGVSRALSVIGSNSAASSNHSQGATSHLPRRTTGTHQGTLYERESEMKTIIQFMEDYELATGVTVLPILGIAGVGKTALAKAVYNHPSVEKQFDHLVWLWVSNSFDATELTKDMLASVSQEPRVGPCDFTKLQETLETLIKSKRVLLILDDVWDGINDYQITNGTSYWLLSTLAMRGVI